MTEQICELGRAIHMRQDGRWPHLPSRILFSHGMPSHLMYIEPLSVHAYTSAIVSARRQVTALDIGSNVGAYAVFAALLHAQVVAVDMQPRCVEMIRCNLKANKLVADVKLGYVARDNVSELIKVPDDDCTTMASPTAVAGRYPHGLMQRKSRIIYGTDNRTHILSPHMRLLPVPPLHFGAFLLASKQLRAPVKVVKIDTEGYEIAVLAALRPIWGTLDQVILELQPRSWHYANVTQAQGLRTLHELMRSRRFQVVTMPHANPREDTARAIANWTACKVPFLPDTHPRAEFVPGKGIRSSRRFHFRGLAQYVSNVYNNPSAHGWFSEILLTNICGDHGGDSDL